MNKVNILIFHDIVKKKINNWADVSMDFFNEFLLTSLRHNKQSSSIINYGLGSKNSTIITFDDGKLSNYKLAFPKLLELNMSATFFICPENINKKDFLTWAMVNEMADHGMEIGSHSMSHPFLSLLRKEEVEYEAQKSKDIIEQNIGQEVVSFAYPYGDFSRTTDFILKSAGYKYICTSKPGFSDLDSTFLRRNSVHSNISIGEIDSLINPSRLRFMKDVINYSLRRSLKEIIGPKNYMSLKRYIYEK